MHSILRSKPTRSMLVAEATVFASYYPVQHRSDHFVPTRRGAPPMTWPEVRSRHKMIFGSRGSLGGWLGVLSLACVVCGVVVTLLIIRYSTGVTTLSRLGVLRHR